MKYHRIALQFIFLCYAFTMQAADAYKIINIASADTKMSLATDISQNGLVCGIAKMKNHTANDSVFIWHPETGLQTVEISSLTPPVINLKGQIAGTFEKKGWFWNNFQGFIWDPQNKITYLNNSSWSNTIARDLSDQGEVLVMNQFATTSKKNPKAKFAVFNNGQFLNNTFSEVQQIDRINNHSDLLGLSFFVQNLKNIVSPLIVNLKTNTLNVLPLVGSAYGYDLNDHGQVIGRFSNAEQNEWKGFLWDPQEGLTIFDSFFPHAINNLGQIVGLDKEQNPSLFENGELKNLNLISRSDPGQSEPWESLIRAVAINDQGKIIGWGLIGSEIQAFILEPIDPIEGDVETGGIDVVIQLDDNSFEVMIAEGIYFVDFYADWCSHCTKMSSVIDDFAQHMQGQLIVAKANIDLNRKMLRNYNVTGIPTMILFKNGQEAKRFTGYRDLPTLLNLVKQQL